MENLLSALLIIIFLWFVIGMIIPLKAAPFFKSKRRIKYLQSLCYPLL